EADARADTQLAVYAWPAQVAVDQQGFAMLVRMSHRQPQRDGRLALGRRCARNQDRAQPAVEIGQQDRIAESANRFIVSSELLFLCLTGANGATGGGR